MPTVLLVRHGRTAANATGVLAGRTPGVLLDDHGAAQARDLAVRLADLPLRRIVASPLERTAATAREFAAIGGTREHPRPPVSYDDRLLECDYGDWTNRLLSELTSEPTWQTVQTRPSAAVFPAGEALAAVQARAVQAVRDHDRQLAEEFGPGALWVAVSHGDVIKAVLADALDMQLDSFQRIVVNTCSVSVISYTKDRPFVLLSNGTGDGLNTLAALDEAAAPSGDAVVGGNAG